MGNFYANITLRGTTPAAVISALTAKRRKAYVTPERDGVICVYDEAIDTQDLQELSDLTARLSADLDCIALGALNHDDDVLYLELWDSGEQKDEYNSNPAYFAEEEPSEDDDELIPDDEDGPVSDDDEDESSSSDDGDEDSDDDEPDSDDDQGPSGGDAFALAYAFGAPDKQSSIDEMLSNPDGFTFAFELHIQICLALGIPTDFAICGFNSLQMGELLPGLDPEDLTKVGL